jgi:hypothetical protein
MMSSTRKSRPMMRCKCVNDACRRKGEWNLVHVERVGNVLLMPPRFVCVCCLHEMTTDSRLLDAYAKVQSEIARQEQAVVS